MTGVAVTTQIDHIVIEAGDEEALFSLFTERLGLPIAWPMAQWGFIHEGGALVGNTNLGCNHPLDPNSDPAPTVRAVALDPAAALADVVDMVRTRGFDATTPMPSGVIDVPDNEPFTPWRGGWTNVLVLDASTDPVPFLCEYDHDRQARRNAERARLDAAGGGPLGVTGLDAVVVHADDADHAAASWRRLLEPVTEPSPGRLQLGAGPALELRAGATPALVFRVKSLAAAARALTERGIAHDRNGEHELQLDGRDVLGLDLQLVERV